MIRTIKVERLWTSLEDINIIEQIKVRNQVCAGSQIIEPWAGGGTVAPSDSGGAMDGGTASQVGLGQGWPRPRSGRTTPSPWLRHLQIPWDPSSSHADGGPRRDRPQLKLRETDAPISNRGLWLT